MSVATPQLIHELSLHWMITFIEGIVSYLSSLSTVDLMWHFIGVLVIVLLFLYRRPLVTILSRVWEKLQQDVEAVVQRQYFSPCEELPPTSEQLPPNTALISAADIEDLNASADAIQQRINHLRMSRVNFVRSRTGIVYKLDSSRKLQIQLTQAREALKKEKAKPKVNFVRSRTGVVFNLRLQKELTVALEKEKARHQDTQEFLDHQTNARADAEEEVERLRVSLETERLRARLETEMPELDENTQLEDIPEEAESRAAQVERLQNQLQVEQANYSFVFKKKEIFRHGGMKLKKELEDLQADFNVLEDDRDTCKETLEALEEQTDVKAVKALRAKMVSDNEHHERRIEALETQLEIEQNSREEAEQVSRDLQGRREELQERFDMAISAYEGLKVASMDLDSLHDPSRSASEETVYERFQDNEEVKKLKAEQARLDAEVEEMERIHEEEVTAEGESWQTYRFASPQTRITTVQGSAPLRRVQSAPLWLPLPHRGDTFDPLYDVSDYGDDDRDSEDGDQGRGEEDKDDCVGERGSGSDGGDGGAEEVATDVAQEHRITDSPGQPEDTLSLESLVNNGQLPANPPTPKPSPPFEIHTSAAEFIPLVRSSHSVLPSPPKPSPPFKINASAAEFIPLVRSSHSVLPSTLEPSPPYKMNASAAEFIPSVRSSQTVSPSPSENTPSPNAAGPGQVRNPHIQELKRLEQRRRRGMPDSAAGEEDCVLLDDILDDMFDRQVTQSLSSTQSSSIQSSREVTPDEMDANSDASSQMSQAPKADLGQKAPKANDEPIVRPSNYWAGIENDRKTFDEEVGDAIAEIVRGSTGKKSLTESMWAPKPAEAVASPAVQGPAIDGPNHEAARVGQSAMQRPSNYWAGIENDRKTVNEEVGDALADIVREYGTKSLAESMWADKPDVKTRAVPHRAASTLPEGVASPRIPIRSDEATRAPPRGPPIFTSLPKSQPPPGAPTGPRGHASRAPRHFETPVRSNDPCTTTEAPLPTPPSSQAAPTPAAGNGNRNPGFSSRGRGRGRGGRGTPTGPRTGNAATDSFRRWQEKMAAEEARKK